MPTPGLIWRHITLTTRGGWLPGDPRGFRARHHKRHSSGDYRQPPPRGEHRGLHRQARERVKNCITLAPTLREPVGRAWLAALDQFAHHTLALAVAANHLHLLTELPVDPSQARRTLGRCKQSVTQRFQSQSPGPMWARGGSLKPITDQAHHRRVFRYIVAHREQGAWVWTFRDRDASS